MTWRACLGSMLLLFLSLRVLGVLQPDDDPNVFRFAERYNTKVENFWRDRKKRKTGCGGRY